MITVKCQHTGFEFEAASKRSKNHPKVAEFLNEANREGKHYRGSGRIAKQLVREASGYENIDELMTDVRNSYEAWKETGDAKKVFKSKKQMAAEYRERQAARQAAWRAGAEQREADASNRTGAGTTGSKDPVEDW